MIGSACTAGDWEAFLRVFENPEYQLNSSDLAIGFIYAVSHGHSDMAWRLFTHEACDHIVKNEAPQFEAEYGKMGSYGDASGQHFVKDRIFLKSLHYPAAYGAFLQRSDYSPCLGVWLDFVTFMHTTGRFEVGNWILSHTVSAAQLHYATRPGLSVNLFALYQLLKQQDVSDLVSAMLEPDRKKDAGKDLCDPASPLYFYDSPGADPDHHSTGCSDQFLYTEYFD
jgi:hypothetical protein